MREIHINDETMKLAASAKALPLTFKEKLELAKLLNNLGVSAIEIEGIRRSKADKLRIKSIAQLVETSVLAVPVRIDGSDVDEVWEALAGAAHPRLQVQVATSPARMEYVHGMKADGLLKSVEDTVRACAKLCGDVEFIADDATRADFAYLASVIERAIDAGATMITVCEDAGKMIPCEFAKFVADLRSSVPSLQGVELGISCSDALHVADSSAMAAAMEGAGAIKSTSYPLGVISLSDIAEILAEKGTDYDMTCPIDTTTLKRTSAQIGRICEQGVPKTSLFSNKQPDEDEDSISLDASDRRDVVAESVAKLGYDLTDEDMALVYEAFLRIASKKDSVGARELDAIVASAALQVPSVYKLKRYTINSGNSIKATAHIELEMDGEVVERVGMGDGPIDAALAAIDDIIGKSYELDDWQMQSVTEGQEAMGEAIIKLVSDGKLYSGRGISTDIVGSSIRAYINAINKAVYEEAEQ